MPLIKDKAYTFYLYALSEVGDSSVFHYIGRSVDPEMRLYQHNRWRQDNELPPVEMFILDSTDTSIKCAQLERHYIHKFLHKGHPLTNRNHRDHICWSDCPAFKKSTDIVKGKDKSKVQEKRQAPLTEKQRRHLIQKQRRQREIQKRKEVIARWQATKRHGSFRGKTL